MGDMKEMVLQDLPSKKGSEKTLSRIQFLLSLGNQLCSFLLVIRHDDIDNDEKEKLNFLQR